MRDPQNHRFQFENGLILDLEGVQHFWKPPYVEFIWMTRRKNPIKGSPCTNEQQITLRFHQRLTKLINVLGGIIAETASNVA
jgi:hypothetical protein